MRAREWKGVAGMEEGKPGESLTLGAEGARPSVAAGAVGEELDSLATPTKTQPPAPAPHRAHPAPRRRSGSPAGTRRPPRDPRHFAPRFASEERGGGGGEKCLGSLSPHTHVPVLVPPPGATCPAVIQQLGGAAGMRGIPRLCPGRASRNGVLGSGRGGCSFGERGLKAAGLGAVRREGEGWVVQHWHPSASCRFLGVLQRAGCG